jgi:hypothetical protein
MPIVLGLITQRIDKDSSAPPGASSPAERDLPCEFVTTANVKKKPNGDPVAEVAITEFKLDQVDDNPLQPINTVQVGAKGVRFEKTGTVVNEKKILFTIKTKYELKNPKAKYTGEVSVMIIAETV